MAAISASLMIAPDRARRPALVNEILYFAVLAADYGVLMDSM